MEFVSTTVKVHAVSLVIGLLKDLSRTNAITATVTGVVKDVSTVTATTLLGGLAGGRSGAIAGGAVGLGALAVSKALGYGDYLPLMTALKQNCTEEELDSLYERLWGRLKTFFAAKNIACSASITALIIVVQKNPELTKNVKNGPIKILGY